jgi:hypothetical protein
MDARPNEIDRVAAWAQHLHIEFARPRTTPHTTQGPMCDKSGEQKDQGEWSTPLAKPAGSHEKASDEVAPFFLDDRSSKIEAPYRHRVHLAAAAFASDPVGSAYPRRRFRF